MPNKKDSYFADLLKRLEEEKIEKGRPVEQIEERRYFLIVCEGTRTEPIYFSHLKSFLPKHLLETIEVSGEGANTISVVNAAIEKRDQRLEDPILPPYDEVWAVFDKDDFPNHRYDTAVEKALKNGIESGESNEAFELWYVLHFQLLETALKRHQYFDILSEKLGVKYVKNDAHIVQTLFAKGNVRQAIAWAKRLEEMHATSTPSESRPYTRIYILVRRLLDYAKYRY